MFSQEKGHFKLSPSEVVMCCTKRGPAFTYTCGPFPPVTASPEEGHAALSPPQSCQGSPHPPQPSTVSQTSRKKDSQRGRRLLMVSARPGVGGDSVWWLPRNVLRMPTAGRQPFTSESRGGHLRLGEAETRAWNGRGRARPGAGAPRLPSAHGPPWFTAGLSRPTPPT